MTERIGAIGSQDDMLARVNKFLKNPFEKLNLKTKGACVASLNDFSKTGNVPGYSDVSIHTQTSYS